MKKFKFLTAALLLWLVLLGAVTVSAAETKAAGQPKLLAVQATGFDSVRITWEKTPKATTYAVYYKTNGKWLYVGKSQGTVYEHKGSKRKPLIPGTAYTYTVKPYFADGTCGRYDTKGLNVRLPKPKIGKTENIKVTCNNYNKMEITWNKTAGASLYRVYIWQNNAWVKLGTTKETSFRHKSSDKAPLSVGKYYRYTVRPSVVYGGKEFRGDYNKKGVSAKVRPQTPTLVRAERTGDTQITFRWNKSEGATKYKVYYKREGASWRLLAEVPASQTQYVHNASSKAPLKQDHTYYYTVRAYSSNGDIHSNRNEKGVSVAYLSEKYLLDQKIHRQAQIVINNLTKPEWSQSQKLNACFNWIMSSRYKPNSNPDYSRPNWQYEWAYDYVCTHAGSCHGFAYGFAALARELGYEPYVITIPHAHSIVRINGGYWDNMHGGLRGVSYRPFAYNESQVFKFN